MGPVRCSNKNGSESKIPDPFPATTTSGFKSSQVLDRQAVCVQNSSSTQRLQALPQPIQARSPATRVPTTLLLVLVVIAIQIGCDSAPDVRVYDAPKSDSQFVSGPLAGADLTAGGRGPRPISPTSTSGPRRILGAVIPMESGCYFLKASDTPDRLQPLMSDFYTLVSRFAVSDVTGKPDLPLPDGWSMNPRNDIAMAEFVAPESLGNVKFTVTVLGMPPAADWQGYLLSNINRWRGQLGLPDLDTESLSDELISVDRPGSLLPGYIFDAVGTGSGAMGGNPPPRTQPAPAERTPANKTPAPSKPSSPPESQESTQPELQYQTPDGWQASPGTPFRLATFRVPSAEGDGEVTVSMAVDNPIANAMMWHQQITREADETKVKSLAEASIANAEPIPSGKGEGVLYTIRDSEQLDAPVLLVASIPSDRPDLHLFIKLRGDNRFAQSQRDNFFQFVQSLSLK